MRDPELNHPSHHLLVQEQYQMHVSMQLPEPVLALK